MKSARTLLLALAFTQIATTIAAAPAPPIPIPNARTPIEGVTSGGQPTPEQIAAAGAAGYKTVINLRAPGESGFDWEPAAVKAAGMDYVAIPVAGAAGLTKENVTQLDAALRQAAEKGPALLHCSSGNRIGALLALRSAWLEGMDPAAAIELGRRSGLTGLESTVREILGSGGPTAAPR